MLRTKAFYCCLILLLSLSLSSCIGGASEASESTANYEEPARKEADSASGYNRVTLSEEAEKRLGLQTGTVELIDDRLVLPYASILYDTRGNTSAFTNPEPHVYIRQDITVAHIEGNQVFLSHGPEPGTVVVTVGVAELYGVDAGITK